MGTISELKSNFEYLRFKISYEKLLKQKVITKLDDKFYSRFEGMYYNGLPIYYYLKEMSMGRCYDASTVLALAFGDNCYVCRGELVTMSISYQTYFGHGWVEKDDFVYDTTWQICCPKEIYYKLFKVKEEKKEKQSIFFKNCKELSDWTIHDKKYYELQSSVSTFAIYTAKSIEQVKLKNPNISKEEREFSLKVLKDLPDISKLNSINIDITHLINKNSSCR